MALPPELSVGANANTCRVDQIRLRAQPCEVKCSAEAALELEIERRFVDCGYAFEDLVKAPEAWFRQFASRSNIGTLDVLHIQAAERFGCRWFLSFDSASDCRAIAAAVGLKVFPELNDQDRDIADRLTG